MNRNRKTSKKIKRSGNKAELEMLVSNCNHLFNDSLCMVGEEECHKVIQAGKCKVIKDYARTHTIGDIGK